MKSVASRSAWRSRLLGSHAPVARVGVRVRIAGGVDIAHRAVELDRHVEQRDMLRPAAFVSATFSQVHGRE